jgi:EmrB/QacA subfamily drug resistance transporter
MEQKLNKEKPKNKNLIFIMAGLMVGLLVAALDNSIIGTAMPQIISNLGGIPYYVWPFTSYMLASTLAIILFGKMSDFYGRKNILLLGIAIFSISSLLCAMSQNIFQLIVFRGVQGLGGGILLSLPFIVMAEVVEPWERAKYAGILSAMFGLANVLGPVIGGFITDFWGWRWIFLVNLPVGVVATALILTSFPHLEKVIKDKFIDYKGIITLTVSLSSLFLALTFLRSSNSVSPTIVAGLFILSIIMLVLFLYVEKRAKEPILPLNLFKDGIYKVSTICMFLASAVMFCAIIYIPLFIQEVLGGSASSSGVIVTPMLISITLGAIITGQIVSKRGTYKKLGMLAFLILAVSMFLLSTMNQSTITWQIVVYSTLLGIGSGMMYPVFNVAVQNALDYRHLAIGTASLQFFGNMGATVALPIFGLIANYTIQSSTASMAKLTPAIINSSIHNVLLAGCLIGIIGFIASLFLKENIMKHKKDGVEIISEKKNEMDYGELK